MQMTYRELRYFKAYCQFRSGHRRTRPARSSYKVHKMRAPMITAFADGMFDDFYRARRRSRRPKC